MLPTKEQINLRPEELTDAGNAMLFHEIFQDDFLFTGKSTIRGNWYHWDGQKWAIDNHAATGCAMQLAQEMLAQARETLEDAEAELAQVKAELATAKAQDLLAGNNDAAASVLADKKAAVERAKAFRKHATRSNNLQGIEGMLKLAKGRFYKDQELLDCHWNELNTPGGVVDLITGKVYPHDAFETRFKYHTKITRCAPSDNGMGEWIKFISDVCCDDIGLMGYLMTVFGMAAFGRVFEEGVYFALGTGRNGKSTTVNSVAHTMADYAGTVSIDVLTSAVLNKDPIIATMQGKRLIVGGEMEEGRRLSAATVKQISSTDPVTVNPKYVDPVTFIPTHTLVLFTNHLPRVDSNDKGTWRRINIIPFQGVFQGANSKTGYADDLVTRCGGAIMKWVIEGARVFAANGFKLEMPDAVAMATEEYQDREDWLQNFLNECCTQEDGATVGSQALYDIYKDWAKANGAFVRRSNEFVQAMKDAGFEQTMPKNRKVWHNIKPTPQSLGRAYA